MTAVYPGGLDTFSTNKATGQPVPSVEWNDRGDALNKLERATRGSATRWVEAQSGWDTVWNAAKASLPGAPAWVAGVGDSVMQGANASNFLTQSWWAQLRAYLLGIYTTPYADFYGLAESVSGAPTYPATPPWVMNTAPASWSLGGYADFPLWNGAIVATAMATFVTPDACTKIDIIYANHFAATSSTWTYTVDGGSTQTVTLPASSRQTLRVSITGLSNATHTLVINGQSASNAAVIYGVVCYRNLASGLGFAKLARQGQVASYFLEDGGVSPASRYLLMQGYTSSAQNDTGFGFPAQPHLAIIALGINDLSGMYGADIFEHALSRLVSAFRRGRADCSIVIMAMSNPDGVSSDVTSNLFPNSISWPQYVRIMQSVAKTFGCAFIDVHGKWGELGVSSGFQVSNNAHPTDLGHSDITNLLKVLV